jgi:hypothetical protein
MSVIQKIVPGVAVLVVGVGFCACGAPGRTGTPVTRATTGERAPEETISKATFLGVWPFTVGSGKLRCRKVILKGIEERPRYVITFRAGSVTYAVNDAAVDLKAGHDLKAIWRKNHDPMAGGPRIWLGDVLDEGLNLCSVGSGAGYTAAAGPARAGAVETTGGVDVDSARRRVAGR